MSLDLASRGARPSGGQRWPQSSLRQRADTLTDVAALLDTAAALRACATTGQAGIVDQGERVLAALSQLLYALAAGHSQP